MTNRLLVSVCLSVLFFLQCGGDNSVTPPLNTLRIFSVNPTTLARGARSVPLTISGSGFTTDLTVDMGPGIEVVSKEVPDAVTLLVTVHVSASADPGPRSIVVNNSSGTARLEGQLTISENRAPLAQFFINPTQGTLETEFVFDASISTDEDGTITGYRWKISDGSTASGIRTRKSFQQKGTYTVQLTVMDNQGGTSSAQRTVEVGENEPPVARFTVTPSTGTQLTPFTFDASGSIDPDGTITGYRWDFGTGETVNGKIVTHRFKKEGEYFVLLQVKDSDGSVSYAKKNLKIAFFDREKAIREIIDVIVEFMQLFADIEILSAEQIVVGFSKNPECSGRAREIAIIESEKPEIKNSGVEFIGDPKVTYVDDRTARAEITNRFYGTRVDGTQYSSGLITHHFTMVHESQGWKICNFYVTEDSQPVNSLRIFGK